MKSFLQVVETSENGFQNPAHFEDSVSGVVGCSRQGGHGQRFDVILLEKTMIPRQNSARLRQHALRHRLQGVEVALSGFWVIMILLVL